MTFLPLTDRRVRGLSHDDYPLTLTLIPAIPEVCAHPFCNVSGRENLELHELWPRSFLRKQPIEFVQLPDETIVRNQVYLCNSFNEGHHQKITENKARIFWAHNLFHWYSEEDKYGALEPQPWVLSMSRSESLLLPPPDDKSPRPVGSGEEKGRCTCMLDGFAGADIDSLCPQHGRGVPLQALDTLGATTEPPEDIYAVGGHEKFGSPMVYEPKPGEECALCHRKLPIKKEKPEKERKRTTWSIRVPKDHLEDGAEILDSLLEECRDILGRDWNEKTKYYTLVESLALLLQHQSIIES